MLKEKLHNAYAEWDGEQLVVDSGTARRIWKRVPRGLATIKLLDHEAGTCWVEQSGVPEPACDWYVDAFRDKSADANLHDVQINTVTDDPLTSDHLAATLTFHYATGLVLKYKVCAYPGMAGFRTQLSGRSLHEREREDVTGYLGGSYSESLAFDPVCCRRRAAGYYNDTQHRNYDETPVLEVRQCEGPLMQANGRRESHDWANLLTLERGNAALTLVKESPKCVNQAHIDTGAFVLEPDSVKVTGLGLTDHMYGGGPWLRHDVFCDCWATWCILHKRSESHRQLAIKRFDRLRFNPDPSRELRSRSNTWGSGDAGDDARKGATEERVLQEIATCRDLNIDAVAIDDGYQCDPEGQKPGDNDKVWRPNPRRFPGGWDTIKKAAEEAGVKLDLWMPGSVDLKHMIRNYDEGGFAIYKLDFLDMRNRTHFDAIMEKARKLSEHSGYKVRISWDATENMCRFGYYYARELGSLHTSNRKHSPKLLRTRFVIYCPRLVLRDTWHYAHYLNLNQLEIPIQNIDRILPEDSNAGQYTHAYTTAISLMGLPLFFQEVQFLDENARNQIRPLMQLYRTHRKRLGNGYVFPIGDEPCDRGWTGFQNHQPDRMEGDMIVFRELDNSEKERSMPLHFMQSGDRLEVEDVIGGDNWQTTLDAHSGISFKIESAPGYRWLRYKHVK